MRSSPIKPWAWCGLMLCMLLLGSCIRPVEHGGDIDEKPVTKPTGATVRMTIDYDDGLEKSYLVAWREKMTVLDVLQAAATRPRGIRFEQRGTGASAMVTAIDRVANEKPGKTSPRSWLYSVNGRMADKSCGIYEVSTGDAILWKFAVYE